MVASGFRGRPGLWMALGCLLGLAIPAALLAAYWGLDSFGWLPSTGPGGQPYLADSNLLRDAGNGDTAASKEKLQAAIQRLSKAIDENQDNALAWYFRAVANERLGEEKLALDDYTEAIRRYEAVQRMSAADRKARNAAPPVLDLANAHYRRAMLLDELSKPGDARQLNAAVDAFSQALVFHPDFVEAYVGRAAAYIELGLPGQAVADLNQAVIRAPDYRSAFALRARAYLKTGNETLAMDDARRALQLDPNKPDAELAFGLALAYSDEDPQKAIEYLERADVPGGNFDAEAKSELAGGYYQVGVRLTKDKKPREANSVFAKAEDLDPSYIARDAEYRERNNLAIHPVQPKVGGQVALKAKPPASLTQSEFEEGVRPYRFVHEIDAKSTDPWEWVGRGLAFLDRGDAVSAIGDFTQAISLEPAFAQAYCQRGRAYAILGDSLRAELDLTDAIRIKPNYPLAYYCRAEAFLKDKRFDRALDDVLLAAEINRKATPGDRQFDSDARRLYVDIRRSQASNFAGTGQFDKAAESLLATGDRELGRMFILPTTATPEETHRRQAELASQVAMTYRDMGLDDFKEKRWTAAIDALKRAIAADASLAGRLNPDLALAYAQRGHDRAAYGDLTGAVADLTFGLRMDPSNAGVCRLAGLASCDLARHYHDRGLTSYERVNWADAIAHLRRAIWLDPKLKYELQAVLDEAQRNLSPVVL